MKERALRAEAVRDEALLAWQDSHAKESKELNLEIRRVKKEVAQLASENDQLLKSIQEESKESVPPSSPNVSFSRSNVTKGKVSFMQARIAPSSQYRLLGGAPGGGEKVKSGPAVSNPSNVSDDVQIHLTRH